MAKACKVIKFQGTDHGINKIDFSGLQKKNCGYCCKQKKTVNIRKPSLTISEKTSDTCMQFMSSCRHPASFWADHSTTVCCNGFHCIKSSNPYSISSLKHGDGRIIFSGLFGCLKGKKATITDEAKHFESDQIMSGNK